MTVINALLSMNYDIMYIPKKNAEAKKKKKGRREGGKGSLRVGEKNNKKVIINNILFGSKLAVNCLASHPIQINICPYPTLDFSQPMSCERLKSTRPMSALPCYFLFL